MNLFWAPAQLAVLAKVVDLNGFSAAARTLGVPKAAVSRAVADLEKALGVRVLERTTRRISLTPPGASCIRTRSAWSKSSMPRTCSSRSCTRQPPARCAWWRTRRTGACCLSPLVPRFLESFPDVPLDVSLHAVDGAQPWDVAIRAGLPDDASVEHRLLGALPAVLCATPQYLQQRGTPAKPEDLRAARSLHAGVGPPGPVSGWSFRATPSAPKCASVPRLTVNDPAVLHASAAAGLGIGLLPEFLCRQGLATGPAEAGADGLVAAARRIAVRRVSGHAWRGPARAAIRRFSRGQHRAGARARLNCASTSFAIDQR